MEVVRALVGAGADLDQCNRSGVTPLSNAARRRGHVEVVRAVLEAGADFNLNHADFHLNSQDG